MSSTTQALSEDDAALLREASEGYGRLKAEIAKTIVGQEPIVRLLLAAIFSEGHALLVGVPGLAKTLLVRTLAETLGWSFKRIQFTPDMMPADIIGMEMLQEEPGRTGQRSWQFMKGPVFANIVLADEINRTPPKTQAALLEAMQELTVTSMGHSHALEKPFVVVATQNPIEQEGTYPLPEAQLDRFMLSLWMDYPAKEEEERIVEQTTAGVSEALERVYSPQQMVAFQGLVRRMPVGRHAVSYAVSLARATRPDDELATAQTKQYVQWGAGPRGAQFLVLAAKALAVLDGRPAVSSDHIRQAAEAVLRHRVLLNYHAAGEGIDSAELIRQILKEVEEPLYSG